MKTIKSAIAGKKQGKEQYKVGKGKPPEDTKFKKGQSGNPKGKPKGTISLTSMIKRKLQELVPDGKRQAIEMLADNIIQDALEHNNKMRQLIWNYVDGMPKQGIDIKHTLKQILTEEQIDELLSRRAKKDNAGRKV